MSRLALGAAALLLFACACSREVHPDFHPQTTYVQNVTYARDVYNLGAEAPRSADGRASGESRESRGCSTGSAPACWSECFHQGRAWACELLSVMFRTGDGVFPDAAASARLHARACALGECARSDTPSGPGGNITSPGGVVVYGDLHGNVVLGR